MTVTGSVFDSEAQQVAATTTAAQGRVRRIVDHGRRTGGAGLGTQFILIDVGVQAVDGDAAFAAGRTHPTRWGDCFERGVARCTAHFLTVV
jgi:hypothetical protein